MFNDCHLLASLAMALLEALRVPSDGFLAQFSGRLASYLLSGRAGRKQICLWRATRFLRGSKRVIQPPVGWWMMIPSGYVKIAIENDHL